MTTEHPISPPPMLRRLWAQQAQRLDPHDPVAWIEHVATQAAQWGADAELEACCEWLPSDLTINGESLRAARRPKPPSLAEQALELVDRIEKAESVWNMRELDIIRAALVRLQELENHQ